MQTTAKKITASVLTTLILSTANFQVKAVEVRGSRQCGTWIAEKNIQAGAENRTWLIGFLSGIAVGQEKNFLRGTENASIFAWFDNYCRTNPLKEMSDAGVDLYFELIKQKRL